jgi:hypothetical protein
MTSQAEWPVFSLQGINGRFIERQEFAFDAANYGHWSGNMGDVDMYLILNGVSLARFQSADRMRRVHRTVSPGGPSGIGEVVPVDDTPRYVIPKRLCPEQSCFGQDS